MAKPAGNIVIKRIKKGGHGHHGGAWKVAYADFVTAMMAFFLLMWLLNASEAENLAGLADYFAPTIGVKDEMGIGFRGGKAAISEGVGADKNTNKGVVFGGVPTGPITKVTTKILERTDEPDAEQVKILIDKTGMQQSKESSAAEENQMQEIKKAVESYAEDMIKNKRLDEGSIEIKRVPEGLLIEIKDVNGDSLFEGSSTKMKDKMKEALSELCKILRNIPNNIAIIGHTSSNLTLDEAGITKWEISAGRANQTRSYIEKNGVQKEQISRIEGRADYLPYDPKRPAAPINNRIDMILLKVNDTPSHKKSAPESIDLKKPEKAYTIIPDRDGGE